MRGDDDRPPARNGPRSALVDKSFAYAAMDDAVMDVDDGQRATMFATCSTRPSPPSHRSRQRVHARNSFMMVPLAEFHAPVRGGTQISLGEAPLTPGSTATYTPYT